MKVDINTAQWNDLLDTIDWLGASGAKIAVRVINRSMNYANKQAAKLVISQYNLGTQKKAKENMKVEKASFFKTPMTARWSSTGKPIELFQFKGTFQTPTGVSVQVKTGGKRSIIPSTFFAKMKSGHEGVFWRLNYQYPAKRFHDPTAGRAFGKFDRGKGPTKWGRLKIHELTGPRMEDLLANAVGETAKGELSRDVETYMLTLMEKEVGRWLKFADPLDKSYPTSDGSTEDII